MNKAIRELNEEIRFMEENYWTAKCDYEQQRADILLNTDFASVIGKAKPTVAEKMLILSKKSAIGDYIIVC